MSKSETKILDWIGVQAPLLLKRDPRSLNIEQLLHMILYDETKNGQLLIPPILEACNQDIRLLNNLSAQNFKDLGLSFKQVDQLLATLELVNRGFEATGEDQTISSSSDAFRFMRSRLSGLRHEEFWIMIMNRANRLTGLHRISSGGVSGTVVDSKLVFQKLLQFSASSVIFVHNHPSGNLKPSQADINLTEKLRNAGDFLDIVVLDHLILSGDCYFSFADEGLIKPD